MIYLVEDIELSEKSQYVVIRYEKQNTMCAILSYHEKQNNTQKNQFSQRKFGQKHLANYKFQIIIAL